MKERREATTETEFDAVLAAGDIPIVRTGYWQVRGSARVVACGSARVVACGSARVEAWESARVVACGSARVVACGSARVEAWESAHVEAWESAHVVARESARVEAWESAHVEAWESAHVVARESAHVVATKYVSCVIASNHRGTIVGGIQVRPDYSTPAAWLEYHGVAITDGAVVLYKAVRDDYRSARGFLYQPGTQVEAPDWDGEARECGGGLHLSPCPAMAKSFDLEATRVLAVRVMVTDLALGPMPLQYPNKIKARRIIEIKEIPASTD